MQKIMSRLSEFQNRNCPPGIRKESGITQEELARKLNTKKSVIYRMENHAEDIRLSTLNKYVETVGRLLRIRLVES